ncbi:hypothetical protein FH580_01100 [Pasteurella multocida]|uniref:hypothetical protein n=1 Tax=Pasteurella multocida TaxID=747 RepID=UPI00111EAF0A|nr:hypothetical protein [Pasteurella multocida]QDB91852.1 hypothetical protein FH580_01100 [Pasteurella multocida]
MEPFCKLAFKYSTKDLLLVEPLDFNQIKEDIKGNAINFIYKLPISFEDKNELIRLYETPWNLMGSGGIKLDLDLHFHKVTAITTVTLKVGLALMRKETQTDCCW